MKLLLVDPYLFSSSEISPVRRSGAGLGADRDGKVSGRHSEGVTPVPIPNTAVKPLSADGTVPDGGMGE